MGGPYLPYHFHQWLSNHPHVVNGWNQTWDIINAANRVLDQVENTIEVSDDVLPGLVAEIRAVRAYAYYVLLDNYGSVPIVTDFSSEELPVQFTRQEVYDFVVTELSEAIPDLTETVDQSTYGRMHKWAAIATLARVYLNAEVYTGTAQYNEVIPLADQIIDSDEFALAPDYRDNFLRSNDTSPEIIFAIPYDEVFAGGNTMHMRTLAPIQQAQYDMGAQPWGGTLPLLNLSIRMMKMIRGWKIRGRAARNFTPASPTQWSSISNWMCQIWKTPSSMKGTGFINTKSTRVYRCQRLWTCP